MKKAFLSRLRTQERAYNDIGIYYTPRLFPKLCKKFPDLKQELSSVYDCLLDNVKMVPYSNNTVKLSEISHIEIRNLQVIVHMNNKQEIQLHDFTLVDNGIRYISLDHSVSFYNLIRDNKNNLPSLVNLTEIIRNGRHLTKEAMRKEYNKVVSAYTLIQAKELLGDVRLLASKTQLVIMPSHKNFSKGKNNL